EADRGPARARSTADAPRPRRGERHDRRRGARAPLSRALPALRAPLAQHGARRRGWRSAQRRAPRRARHAPPAVRGVIVMKFGGTSLADADRIRAAAEIV